MAEKLPDNHPQKKNLVAYKTAYEEKFDEAVSGFGGYAYDSLMLVVEGLKKIDDMDDKAALRAAIESITNFPRCQRNI